MLTKIILLCLVGIGYVHSKKLPSYIKACSRSDPNFDQCAMDHAIAALPSIFKGDKDYKYPRLDPFSLESVEIHPSDTLAIKLKDITLTGVSTAKIEELKLDFDKKHLFAKISVPSVNLICQYTVEGKILVLPISGSGPGNMTFENLVVDFNADYVLLTKKDGKQYIDPNFKTSVSFTLGKAIFDLKNLFNGDKALGEHMNKFLNENDQAVAKDLGVSVSETINAIATQILKKIVSVVPYDEILLP